jgi:hypothetical protein
MQSTLLVRAKESEGTILRIHRFVTLWKTGSILPAFTILDIYNNTRLSGGNIN